MEPLALIKRIASLIHELVAPRYRPELHYMRGPGPACRRRSAPAPIRRRAAGDRGAVSHKYRTRRLAYQAVTSSGPRRASMNLAELQNYQCWIGKTPHEVFFAAKMNGGWKNVFPTNVPVWASKVRNYFNVLPTTLKRLPKANAKALLDRPQFMPFLVRAKNDYWANRTYQDYKPKPWGYDPLPFKPHPMAPAKIPDRIMKMSQKEPIALERALSGDVYLDNLNRPWFQMAAGSTIYHWGDHPIRRPPRRSIRTSSWDRTIRPSSSSFPRMTPADPTR